MVVGVTVGGIFQRLYKGTGGENKKGAASMDVSRRPSGMRYDKWNEFGKKPVALDA